MILCCRPSDLKDEYLLLDRLSTLDQFLGKERIGLLKQTFLRRTIYQSRPFQREDWKGLLIQTFLESTIYHSRPNPQKEASFILRWRIYHSKSFPKERRNQKWQDSPLRIISQIRWRIWDFVLYVQKIVTRFTNPDHFPGKAKQVSLALQKQLGNHAQEKRRRASNADIGKNWTLQITSQKNERNKYRWQENFEK